MAKSVREYQRQIKDLSRSKTIFEGAYLAEQKDRMNLKKKITSIEQGAHQLRNRLNYEMGRADGLAAALATVAVAATRKDGKNV